MAVSKWWVVFKWVGGLVEVMVDLLMVGSFRWVVMVDH